MPAVAEAVAALRLARRQTGSRALMRVYAMGELTSLVTLCELGDVGRLSRASHFLCKRGD
jgi:hypothetical protein